MLSVATGVSRVDIRLLPFSTSDCCLFQHQIFTFFMFIFRKPPSLHCLKLPQFSKSCLKNGLLPC